MIHYTALSMLLIVVAFEIHRFLQVGWRNWRTLLVLLTILTLLMLVFDTYLTTLPIVEYNKSLVLGLRIGSIPLEDFGYLLAVVILGPSLYEYFSNHED
jgi:lycopene cyclase domain-containing protein